MYAISKVTLESWMYLYTLHFPVEAGYKKLPFLAAPCNSTSFVTTWSSVGLLYSCLLSSMVNSTVVVVGNSIRLPPVLVTAMPAILHSKRKTFFLGHRLMEGSS